MDDPLELAKAAVDELFSDTSVTARETLDRLMDLREEIDGLIALLEGQIGS